MLQALAQYRIVGVANNVEFLSRLVACPAFAQADLDTGLIERERAFLFPEKQRRAATQAYLSPRSPRCCARTRRHGAWTTPAAIPTRHGA